MMISGINSPDTPPRRLLSRRLLQEDQLEPIHGGGPVLWLATPAPVIVMGMIYRRKPRANTGASIRALR